MEIRFSRKHIIPRRHVTYNIVEQLHTDLLACAGANNASASDMLNYCLAIAIPVLSANPEIVDTLRAKFSATV